MKIKRVINKYTYTCSVCNKSITSNAICVTVPQIFNLGEDGDMHGKTEWHLHSGEGYSSCKSRFVRHINEQFKGQDLDLCNDEV